MSDFSQAKLKQKNPCHFLIFVWTQSHKFPLSAQGMLLTDKAIRVILYKGFVPTYLI